MHDQGLSILNVSYKHDESVRVLNSIFSEWFSDPKTLHFTSPKLKYPFNINQWIKLFYTADNTKSYILKANKWIIGHISVRINENNNSAHLFHLIIESDNRRKGYAKKLIKYVQKKVSKDNIKYITINCVRKNNPAISLYQTLGFKKIKEKRWLKMIKYI
jgi:ribosomal protein S18 acetylase RimI-like enzyme